MAVIFFAQRWIIYHPYRDSEPQMISQAKAEAMAPWRDKAGHIVGWRRDATRISPAVNKLLVFHGNTGNAIYREHYIAGFESIDDGRQWEVFLFEYPGFGARPGKANRDSINEAALAAVKELMAMDARPVFVLGESLGSGAACELAAREPGVVKGLALVTPYARLAEVAQSAFPFIPAGLMLLDRWDNIESLQRSRTPVAVVIAGRDEVVGSDQGERLYASLGERPKRRLFFPEARHNTLEFNPGASWWSEVSRFLRDSSQTTK
jgi:pimeloyl-ACP methyl ester carboxylesterase